MEIYRIPVGDKYIIYRPLAGLAFVGNPAMADLAARLAVTGLPPEASPPQEPGRNGQAAMFLKQIGFFEPDPASPGLRLPDPSGADFQPTLAVLLLTNRCQLRCVYCYAAAGEHPQRDLTFDLGTAAIDYVAAVAASLNQERFYLAFHGGGEPTTAWKVLQACTDYARQKPLSSRISLTSNGIWSHSQVDWITANLDEVSISMDGSRQTQDRQRPFVSGRNSSSWIMRTLAELDRCSYPYAIRMTAAAPWESLPGDVRFLCEATGCRSIQVEPAFNAGRGGHGLARPEEAGHFIDAFLEAYEFATRAGRRLYCSSARLGVVANIFCTAPYNALIVNADSDLVTCYEISGESHPLISISRIGQVENGEVKLDFARRASLHSRMSARRSGCRGCFCFWSCAGDCYTRAFSAEPEGHLVYSPRCNLNRALTSQLLLKLIAQNGGVWRSPRRAAPASALYADDGLG